MIDITYGLVVCCFIILYQRYTCSCREGFSDNIENEDMNDTSKQSTGTEDVLLPTSSSELPYELQANKLDNIDTDIEISNNHKITTTPTKTIMDTKIPKIIIQTWKTKEIPIKYQGLVDSIKYNNPSYEYKFFTDADIEEFLKNNYPEYYKTYQNLPILIQKIDFFRYVAIYHYGGFYFDLDMTGLYPLDELLNKDCVFPIDEFIQPHMCKANRFKYFCENKMYYLLGQYAFAASPKHPFIKLLIDTIHQNLHKYIRNYVPNSEDYVYLTTGPDYVTKLYMNYSNKNSVQILNYDKRQYFGKYAKHNYFGTWKLA